MSNPTSPTKAVAVVTGTNMLTDTGRFEHSYRVAKVFSGSQLVPKHLQGKVEDVMIALNIADRLGEDPLTVMQSIYIVSGKAGWSSSYMIARINQSGLIKGRITWDVTGTGKDLTVTAKATLADTGEVVSASASMQMAMAEGWTSNKKYQTMPEHMLRFRAASMLQRLYFPEVMLGMRTAEELETEQREPVDVTPRGGQSAAQVLEAFAAKAEPQPVDVPVAVVEASDVPADGPNVFDRDDEQKVKELKERTGVKDEVIDAETGEVSDAKDYLANALAALAEATSPDEVKGMTDTVKQHLASYPELIAEWNRERYSRLAQITTNKKGR